MPVYACRVADESGKMREFFREAASEEPLLRELSTGRQFILSVREVTGGERPVVPRRGFSQRVVGELTDLLTLMTGSGLSLKDSLEVAQTVFGEGPGYRLVTLLLERIGKGAPFAAALEAAGSFPPVYRGMVRIGERIGSLDRVFARLSAWLADQKKLRDRVAAALLYPAIVLGVSFVGALFLVAVLFPRLREIFAQLGPQMESRVESLTSSLAVTSAIFGGALAAAACCALAAVRAERRGGPGARRMDSLALRLPLLRTFLMQRELLNFAFAMEALTAAGVSVEEALRESASAVKNTALSREIFDVREKVMKGEHLSAAFARSALFPARVGRWVRVGERMGHVEKVFMQLRVYYQQEVEKWIHRLMTLIEPALIVALGIVIVLFIVFFIVPVLSLSGTLL